MKEHRSGDSEIESGELQQPYMSPMMEHCSSRANKKGGEQQQRHLAPSVSTTLYQPEPVPSLRQTTTGIPHISPSMTQYHEFACGPEQGRGQTEKTDYVLNPILPLIALVSVESSLVVDTVTAVPAKRGKRKRWARHNMKIERNMVPPSVSGKRTASWFGLEEHVSGKRCRPEKDNDGATHTVNMESLHGLLHGCATRLQKWNKENRIELFAAIKKMKNDLAFEGMHVGPDSWRRIRRIEQELDELLGTEERYWKDRSRVNWLRHDDRNTRFFHMTALGRRAQNMI
ncbi:hypothetical protein ACOSQ4_030882 [Xanthoceras sorbifolium]